MVVWQKKQDDSEEALASLVDDAEQLLRDVQEVLQREHGGRSAEVDVTTGINPLVWVRHTGIHAEWSRTSEKKTWQLLWNGTELCLKFKDQRVLVTCEPIPLDEIEYISPTLLALFANHLQELINKLDALADAKRAELERLALEEKEKAKIRAKERAGEIKDLSKAVDVLRKIVEKQEVPND